MQTTLLPLPPSLQLHRYVMIACAGHIVENKFELLSSMATLGGAVGGAEGLVARATLQILATLSASDGLGSEAVSVVRCSPCHMPDKQAQAPLRCKLPLQLVFSEAHRHMCHMHAVLVCCADRHRSGQVVGLIGIPNCQQQSGWCRSLRFGRYAHSPCLSLS